MLNIFLSIYFSRKGEEKCIDLQNEAIGGLVIIIDYINNILSKILNIHIL